MMLLTVGGFVKKRDATNANSVRSSTSQAQSTEQCLSNLGKTLHLSQVSCKAGTSCRFSHAALASPIPQAERDKLTSLVELRVKGTIWKQKMLEAIRNLA